MLSPQILALAFTLAPSLVSAGLFPSDSLVKVIDAKGFKKAMKANVGLVVDLSWTQGMILIIYSGNKYGGFLCTLVWCTLLNCFKHCIRLTFNKTALPTNGSGIQQNCSGFISIDPILRCRL